MIKHLYQVGGHADDDIDIVTHVCMELDGYNAGRIRFMTNVEYATHALEKRFARPGDNQED